MPTKIFTRVCRTLLSPRQSFFSSTKAFKLPQIQNAIFGSTAAPHAFSFSQQPSIETTKLRNPQTLTDGNEQSGIPVRVFRPPTYEVEGIKIDIIEALQSEVNDWDRGHCERVYIASFALCEEVEGCHQEQEGQAFTLRGLGPDSREIIEEVRKGMDPTFDGGVGTVEASFALEPLFRLEREVTREVLERAKAERNARIEEVVSKKVRESEREQDNQIQF